MDRYIFRVDAHRYYTEATWKAFSEKERNKILLRMRNAYTKGRKMKIVVDIPKEEYEEIRFCECVPDHMQMEIGRAIINGTPLPKGHGRLIDADAIPKNAELKGFLMQDDMHLVTIDRVKAAIKDAPTIIEADSKN